MSKYAIQVKDVRKRFSYSSHKNNSLKRAITQVFKPKDSTVNTFYALDGVSFNVEKGDFFGILGRNGSGKSTLLKIISEIYQPTSGSVNHDGKLVSFIELGVGFKSELTGKENVYLNAALLGFSRSEIDEMYDDIVEFSELEKFMDQQLKNYSSGMKVRLAFSVAIRAKADILILDEVLAVGDADFQKKCTDYFETLKEDGKTVVLVTHSMGNVRKFCNKAVVIEDGSVIFEGDPDEAADEYLRLFAEPKQEDENDDEYISPIKIESASIEQDGAHVKQLTFLSDASLRITFESAKEYSDVVVIAHIATASNNRHVAVLSTKEQHMDVAKGSNSIVLKFKSQFLEESYHCNIVIGIRNQPDLLCQRGRLAPFTVANIDKDKYPKRGFVYLESKIGE